MERAFPTFDPGYFPFSHAPTHESTNVHDSRNEYAANKRHGGISAGTSSPAGFDLSSFDGRSVGSSFHPRMNGNQMNAFMAQQWNGLAMDPSYLQMGPPNNGVVHGGVVRGRSSAAGVGYHRERAGQDHAICGSHCDEECRSQCGEAGEMDVCEDPHCDAVAIPCTKEDCKVPTCDDADCLVAEDDVDDKAAAAALASIVASQASQASPSVQSPSMNSQHHVSHLSAHAHSALSMSSPTVSVSTLMGTSHVGHGFTASTLAPDVMLGQNFHFTDMSEFPADLGIQLDLLGDAVMHHLPTSAPHTRPCLWNNQAAMSQNTCRLCDYPYYGYRQFLDHFEGAHTQLFNTIMEEVFQQDGGVGHVDQQPGQPAPSTEEIQEASQERAETATPSAAPSPMNSETPATMNSVESIESHSVPSFSGSFTCRWLSLTGKPCGQVFESEEDLQRHAMEHGKELKKPEPLRCLWEGCTREIGERGIFSQRSKLDRHLQTHTGCKCRLCSISVPSASDL